MYVYVKYISNCVNIYDFMILQQMDEKFVCQVFKIIPFHPITVIFGLRFFLQISISYLFFIQNVDFLSM